MTLCVRYEMKLVLFYNIAFEIEKNSVKRNCQSFIFTLRHLQRIEKLNI